MKRVFITGGTGMLGANLARKLVADGVAVCMLGRALSNRIRLKGIENDITFLQGDITDQSSVQNALDRAVPDVVYHLACTPFTPPIHTPEEHLRINALGALHVLESLRKASSTRLVFTGSAAVYQARSHSSEDDPLKPATMLGAAKASAAILVQTYARLHGMRTSELRLFMPYGPWEHPRRLVPQAVLAALDHRNLPMSQGTQERDLVFVADVVEALVQAGTIALAPGTVINIGSGVGTPIRDVVEKIFALTASKGRALLGALPMRPDEIMVMSANIEKAHGELNWQPRTTLEQGLLKTIEWIKANRTLLCELGG